MTKPKAQTRPDPVEPPDERTLLVTDPDQPSPYGDDVEQEDGL